MEKTGVNVSGYRAWCAAVWFLLEELNRGFRCCAWCALVRFCTRWKGGESRVVLLVFDNGHGEP